MKTGGSAIHVETLGIATENLVNSVSSALGVISQVVLKVTTVKIRRLVTIIECNAFIRPSFGWAFTVFAQGFHSDDVALSFYCRLLGESTHRRNRLSLVANANFAIELSQFGLNLLLKL